jgi:hypothetical protein
MDCCGKPQSRAAFLEEKLKNFRAYVLPYCDTKEKKERLAEFGSVEAITPFLLQAVALRQAGTLDQAVDAFASEFRNAPEPEAFKAKVRRYVDMFCDVLTS